MNGNWGWALIVFGLFALIQGLIGADFYGGSAEIDPAPKYYYVLSRRMRMIYKSAGVVSILVGCGRLIYKWVV